MYVNVYYTYAAGESINHMYNAMTLLMCFIAEPWLSNDKVECSIGCYIT